MNIMVFDVPAASGGALTILNDFYEEVVCNNNKKINWIFVVSKPVLQDTENIKILRFPWIKKSWFHRLYFDHIIAPRLIRNHDVSKIISLQNVIIPHVDIKQILYVHQPLPFIDYRFTFKENKLFWIYQNIISKYIIRSIQKAAKVIVQTEWMKVACVKKARIKSEKISVIPPQIKMNIFDYFKPDQTSISTFFYPASGFKYKNHQIIVEACKKLKYEHNLDLKVVFTLSGKENNHISQLFSFVKKWDLPIEFAGSLSREEVFRLYAKSVLLFPSYIETFGLPMLEARLHKAIILASDCSFSREILDEYNNAYFFNPFDLDQLVELMKEIMCSIKYNQVDRIIANRNLNGLKSNLINEVIYT